MRLMVVNEEQEDEVFCDEAILIAVARFWCGMMDGDNRRRASERASASVLSFVRNDDV